MILYTSFKFPEIMPIFKTSPLIASHTFSSASGTFPRDRVSNASPQEGKPKSDVDFHGRSNLSRHSIFGCRQDLTPSLLFKFVLYLLLVAKLCAGLCLHYCFPRAEAASSPFCHSCSTLRVLFDRHWVGQMLFTSAASVTSLSAPHRKPSRLLRARPWV